MNLILDIEAAAIEAGVGVSTIRRWVARGRLPLHAGRVWSDDVRAVKAEMHAARLATLKQHRVRVAV